MVCHLRLVDPSRKNIGNRNRSNVLEKQKHSSEMIRAGRIDEANRDSGDWIFVDVGFAKSARSCGVLLGDELCQALSFSQLRVKLQTVATEKAKPLNILLEAPLSVAFNAMGNPTGRSIERRENQTRYWYVGPGCSVLVATTHLLRAIYDVTPSREIRLFEGFASFKPKGVRSSHCEDVLRLHKVIWEGESALGCIIPAEQLLVSPDHRLQSAFFVAGMDFGVPPVVVLGG